MLWLCYFFCTQSIIFPLAPCYKCDEGKTKQSGKTYINTNPARVHIEKSIHLEEDFFKISAVWVRAYPVKTCGNSPRTSSTWIVLVKDEIRKIAKECH